MCGVSCALFAGSSSGRRSCECGAISALDSNYCNQCGTCLQTFASNGSDTKILKTDNSRSSSDGSSSGFINRTHFLFTHKWAIGIIIIGVILCYGIYSSFYSDKAIVIAKTKQLVEMLYQGKGLEFSAQSEKKDIRVLAEVMGVKSYDTVASNYLMGRRLKQVKESSHGQIDYSIGKVEIINGTHATVYVSLQFSRPANGIQGKPLNEAKNARFFWVKQSDKWELSARTFMGED